MGNLGSRCLILRLLAIGSVVVFAVGCKPAFQSQTENEGSSNLSSETPTTTTSTTSSTTTSTTTTSTSTTSTSTSTTSSTTTTSTTSSSTTTSTTSTTTSTTSTTTTSSTTTSTTSTTLPDLPVGNGEPLFQDDFESGDFSKVENGAYWGSANSVHVRDPLMEKGVTPISGQYALKFRYDPVENGKDDTSEMPFKFGRLYNEVWLEYWFYVPNNYKHRKQGTIDGVNYGPSNNKFLQLNQKGYNGKGKNMLTVEYARSSDSGSGMRRFLSESEHADGSKNWPTGTPGQSDFLGHGMNVPAGEWANIRVHYKTASGPDIYDGRVEIFVNGVLFHSLDWAFWDDQNAGAIFGGYLMGWSNSGYDEETVFWIDDFKIYVTDPEW